MSAFQITVSVMGSTPPSGLMLSFIGRPHNIEDDVPLWAQSRHVAWQDHGGTVGILDDGRPGYGAVSEPAAVDDERLDQAPGLRKPGLPLAGAATIPLAAGAADDGVAVADGQGGNQRPVHDLYGPVRIEELVLALIGLIEGGNGLGGVTCIDRAGRKVDVDLEALARVAHLRIARPLRLSLGRDPLDVAQRLRLQGLVERGDLNT